MLNGALTSSDDVERLLIGWSRLADKLLSMCSTARGRTHLVKNLNGPLRNERCRYWGTSAARNAESDAEPRVVHLRGFGVVIKHHDQMEWETPWPMELETPSPHGLGESSLFEKLSRHETQAPVTDTAVRGRCSAELYTIQSDLQYTLHVTRVSPS